MRITDEDWQPRGIDRLEPAARDALRAGTASVTAGPGAGKSEFLAQRAAYLFELGLCEQPRQIMAISFKRSAASNLRERVEARLPEYASRFTSLTFDTFTKSIVDRFRQLLPNEWTLCRDYKIGTTGKQDVIDFLNAISKDLPPGQAAEVRALNVQTFLSGLIGATELPTVPSAWPAPSSASEFALKKWWQLHYFDKPVPTLDFVMLNRLADLIIRTSPRLQMALRETYPYVFVDEFQDTTFAQYSFLRTAFPPNSTVITAVGDSNQRIMGWAGALDGAFDQFTSDYSAEPFRLTYNFRSTQQLVDLQHRFAMRLDPTIVPQLSQISSDIGERAIEFWSFSSSALEAASIASWIVSDMEVNGRQAKDYALIARQTVDRLEPALLRAFSAAGLRLRNDDAKIGDIRLQDLLADKLVHLYLGMITLAASRGGNPQAWRSVTDTMRRARSGPVGLRGELQAEMELETFLKQLRAKLAKIALSEVEDEAAADRIANGLTEYLASFVSAETIGGRRIFGDRAQDLDASVTAFRLRLAQSLIAVSSWDLVEETFLDEDTVTLSTIHRSKGLEYATVFFVGLDRNLWWAHTKDEIESTMAFYVGVSRAAEQLIFTRCDERGKKAPLGVLYDDLEAAGVGVRRFDA